MHDRDDRDTMDAELVVFHELAMGQLDHVLRYARWLTKDEADADDLVQETFLKALRAWRSFQPGTDCRAWLFTICRHAHLGQRRRDGRVEAVEAPDLETLAAVEVFRSAQATGLDGIFGAFDLRDALRRELLLLPDAFREAVELVDLRDLTYDDAARILGAPVGTVRSRLYRGRRLLQQGLLAHAHDAGFVRTVPHPGGEPPMDPMPDCDAVLRDLWAYLDDALTEERRAAIAMHLKVCNRCFPTFAFEEAFLRALATAEAMPVNTGPLRDRVMAALRREGLPDLR